MENGNPSTQPTELSDERGRVELIESTLFVSIAENKTNSLEKNDSFIVKLWGLWIKGYKEV